MISSLCLVSASFLNSFKCLISTVWLHLLFLFHVCVWFHLLVWFQPDWSILYSFEFIFFFKNFICIFILSLFGCIYMFVFKYAWFHLHFVSSLCMLFTCWVNLCVFLNDCLMSSELWSDFTTDFVRFSKATVAFFTEYYLV